MEIGIITLTFPFQGNNPIDFNLCSLIHPVEYPYDFQAHPYGDFLLLSFQDDVGNWVCQNF